jgi:hypothetical protein
VVLFDLHHSLSAASEQAVVEFFLHVAVCGEQSHLPLQLLEFLQVTWDQDSEYLMLQSREVLWAHFLDESGPHRGSGAGWQSRQRDLMAFYLEYLVLVNWDLCVLQIKLIPAHVNL